MDTTQRVIEVMADVFDCPLEQVAQLRAGESDVWDSVAQATLHITLEETFGVMIEAESAEEMTNLEGIVAAVTRAMGR